MGLKAPRWPSRLLPSIVLASLLAGQLPAFASRMFWYHPPAAPTTASPTVSPGPSQPVLAYAVLGGVNQFRAKYNLPPVRLDPRLNIAAQDHSNYMAAKNVLTHTGRGGSDPGQRIESAGYRWTTIAENVAAGQTSANEVVRDWINSPGHRANMLKASITDIGVGRNGDYWTLDLAAQHRASR